MSIRRANGCRDLLVRVLEMTGRPLSRLTIGELGNQKIKGAGGTEIRYTSAKAVLSFLGARHVSLDRNGRDGAIAVDLSRPVRSQLASHPELRDWLGQCDVVTNFGTIEHVAEDQFVAWSWMHALCRRGGLMAHALPRSRSCRRHGVWKYTERWVRRLALQAGYEVHYMSAVDMADYDVRKSPGAEMYLHCIMGRGHRLRWLRRDQWTDPRRR